MGSDGQTDQEMHEEELVGNAESASVQEPVSGELLDEDVDTVDLHAELEAANVRADENWEKVLLAKAEVENIRRRTQKDVEKAHRFSVEKFAKDMLPVIDSVEMGLTAASESTNDVSAIVEGMDLTHKQLLSSLNKSGVEQINPEGAVFNAELHQAISVVPSPDHEPNTVMQVFQKGYSLNGRLLRPAMVIVSQAQPPADTKKIDEQA